MNIANYKIPIFKSFFIFLCVYFTHSYFDSNPVNPKIFDFVFHTINLIFHEAGHTFFIFFGDFLHILGGSLFQIAVPLAIIGYFLFKRKEVFSASVIFFWLAGSFHDVAVYIADAPFRNLQLLGDDPDAHDWYNLLTMTNSLSSAERYASFISSCADFSLVLGLTLGLYAIWKPYWGEIKGTIKTLNI